MSHLLVSQCKAGSIGQRSSIGGAMTSDCGRTAVVICSLLASLLAGCATRDPFRICQAAMPGLPAGVQVDPGGCDDSNSLFEQNAKYALHFTEFDDQGWVHDEGPRIGQAPAQIDRVMQHLNHLVQVQVQVQVQAQAQRKTVRLYVYVHGWRHSARPGDDDVREFRSFLAKRADLNAQEQVVGIFVGWRGLPIERIPGVELLTFWDRLGTAERVAQGSVRELFARLRALKRAEIASTAAAGPAGATAGPAGAAAKPRLLTFVLGHSFGAQIAYRAVSQALLGSFADELDSPTGEPVARLFEAVVLVNPAIEAAPFEPLYRVARQRLRACVSTAKVPGQAADCAAPAYAPPALLVFTSRGDAATRVFFPLGTQLGNLFQAESSARQREANRRTIGWDADYRTHVLDLGQADCATPVPPTLPATLPPALPPTLPPTPPTAPIGSSDGLQFASPGWSVCLPTDKGAALLQHLAPAGSDAAFNGPIWNVLVDSALVEDHGDVWNLHFTQVLDALFADFTATRDSPTKRAGLPQARPQSGPGAAPGPKPAP